MTRSDDYDAPKPTAAPPFENERGQKIDKRDIGGYYFGKEKIYSVSSHLCLPYVKDGPCSDNESSYNNSKEFNEY